MLSGADLDKILDDGYGDSGFNDPVPDVAEDAPAKAAPARASSGPKGQPSKVAPSEEAVALAKPGSQQLPKPYERPAISGAPAPPPSGADPKQYEIAMALDQVAREKGYKNAEEYNKYLEESGALKAEPQPEMEQETQLAPGIKKAPAYMPPGAYPGDRTKIGKAYEKERPDDGPQKAREIEKPQVTFVKQADRHDIKRAQDGNTITFRLGADGETQSAEVGGTTLPWALDYAVRTMKLGDVVDVVGCGEYAFSDSEKLEPNAERQWRLELVSIGGQQSDKFGLAHEERLALAEQLRLRGNEMFKQQRFHRAMKLYERGSALMDVLEAEEMGMPGGIAGKPDPKVVERNQQIWQCQKPLLLNWALILIKLERWVEAERKCTEVLMDIDKLNVKALFRRGQCNIRLGNHEQARLDLSRAAELDTSITKEVEREMAKVRQMQQAEDKSDSGAAKKAVEGLLEAGDARSAAPPPAEQPAAPDPSAQLIDMLDAQESAAERSQADNDTFCRQREAIYNQFLNRRSAQED
uniref:peptidylprolyl isomerase n=1 Tax=Alexandrium catenella TaxID=2925 RepID=A0A7S1RMV4_ALECA